MNLDKIIEDIKGYLAGGKGEGMSTVTVEVDTTISAAYICISNEPVDSTSRFNESVIVDLDRFGMVVGIEVLDYRMEDWWPLIEESDSGSDFSTYFYEVFPKVVTVTQYKPAEGARRTCTSATAIRG